MKKTKKEIYFEFYDKLPYPINAWAKHNYDDSFSEYVPKSFLELALVRGWEWRNSKFIKSPRFWDSVRLNVDNKSRLLTLAKDAIRIHYFKYYNEIPDKIIAEKAKFNYDNHLEVCDPLREWLPNDIDEALGSGFSFEHTPEGYDYWRSILNSLPSDNIKKSTENMSPRKQKSFEFYDILPSPIKEWAKENFDESHSTIVPTSIGSAILDGWNFAKSKNNCNNRFWFRVGNIDIADLIEVKRLTEEALKEQSKTETMSDLKKTYFKFYGDLPKLLGEWACANFDETYAKKRNSPESLYWAINEGWNWKNSKHGDYKLWQLVIDNANNRDKLIEIQTTISKKSDVESPLTPHTRGLFNSSIPEIERRDLFFRYYDKLPYPISDMAKANYSANYSAASPYNTASALRLGFDMNIARWGSTIFWMAILNSLDRYDFVRSALAVKAIRKFSSSFNNLNNSNQNQNEKQKSKGIQVRKPTPSISTGERRISNPIQGARSKTSIAIGYLSNAKISTCS